MLSEEPTFSGVRKKRDGFIRHIINRINMIWCDETPFPEIRPPTVLGFSLGEV